MGVRESNPPPAAAAVPQEPALGGERRSQREAVCKARTLRSAQGFVSGRRRRRGGEKSQPHAIAKPFGPKGDAPDPSCTSASSLGTVVLRRHARGRFSDATGPRCAPRSPNFWLGSPFNLFIYFFAAQGFLRARSCGVRGARHAKNANRA